jgi:hypothetical protein
MDEGGDPDVCLHGAIERAFSAIAVEQPDDVRRASCKAWSSGGQTDQESRSKDHRAVTSMTLVDITMRFPSTKGDKA